MREEFNYLSAEGMTQLHAVKWRGDSAPIAVLQVVHGMCEFVLRYKDFAEYLAALGIVVVGHDHLGHGESVSDSEAYGYFCAEDGNAVLLEDIHALRTLTEQEYPGVPYFILGHSMGSFLVRQYITRHSEGLDGAIIMGTGSQPSITLKAAKTMCKLIAARRGWKYRSKLVDNMAFGSYNKRFKPPRTSKDWLTKDNRIVDEYIINPLCMFKFTLNGYYNLFYSIQDCQDKANNSKVRRDLPVYFVAGADDPVGSFGKGVVKAHKALVSSGVKDAEIKLYGGDRHEILNETDRVVVYEDIYNWIISKLHK